MQGPIEDARLGRGNHIKALSEPMQGPIEDARLGRGNHIKALSEPMQGPIEDALLGRGNHMGVCRLPETFWCPVVVRLHKIGSI